MKLEIAAKKFILAQEYDHAELKLEAMGDLVNVLEQGEEIDKNLAATDPFAALSLPVFQDLRAEVDEAEANGTRNALMHRYEEDVKPYLRTQI